MMSALAFLTVLGRSGVPDARTLRWFPVVGALIGAVVAGSHWGAHQLWSPLIAGGLVLAVDLAITGALHLDGLADSADGLLPHMERPRRLQVMAQPDVGAFAVAVVVAVCVLRWALFADVDVDPAAFVAIWAISRTIVAVIPAMVPYARPDGLASPFLAGSRLWLLVWLIPPVVTLVVVSGTNGAIAATAAIVASAGVIALARKRLGGFTGDVLGAVILLGETAALLALTAQP